jgi:proteasome activator subunit 4
VCRRELLTAKDEQVLAVAAAVLSSPTQVPEWMPDAVCALCVLTDEETIIRSTVTSTVGDFRKSHQDSWEEIRMTWTEDQLRLVSESSGTQSYFS